MPASMRTAIATETAFDLNIGKVLEHWTVSYAVREVIANALDEQAITGTSEPTILRDGTGSWHIADAGRGLRYEHLAQNESAEKRRYPDVIGQFGMGLKDALAVFDRHGVEVLILSPHGDIAPDRRPKENFADVVTLQAIVRPATDPGRKGTDVVLRGVADEDIERAKAFFLRYSNETVLETTRYGQVLASPPKGRPAHVYVKGLLVAEEDNFLFSYNITNLSAPLRRALNRERTNVGRAAYSERVKSILKECKRSAVAEPLAEDLGAFTSGRQHDELAWLDVALHACRVLASNEKVVFVTTWQYGSASPQLQYARDEGYRLVVVPDAIAQRLGTLKDIEGRPLLDFVGYRRAWNDSFQFSFVAPEALTVVEKQVFGLTEPACRLIGANLDKMNIEVLVSETMRLNESGRPVVGVWEGSSSRIVIRRDQLAQPATYCGTLLHEVSHARSGATDNSLDFENELTRALGHMAAAALGVEQRSGVPDSGQPPDVEDHVAPQRQSREAPGKARRQAPTLAGVEVIASRLPAEEAPELLRRAAPAGRPSAKTSQVVPSPEYVSWEDFLARTPPATRLAWCREKARKANRARLMSGPPETQITPGQVWTVLEAARGKCAYCGSLALENRPSKANGAPAPWGPVGRRIGSLSHRVSRFAGGTNTVSNLVWSCLWCNTWPSERVEGATDHGGYCSAT